MSRFITLVELLLTLSAVDKKVIIKGVRYIKVVVNYFSLNA